MSVSREEYRWVVWFGVVVMLITMLPYVAAYAAQGEEWTFTGFIIGVEDGNSYIAKMLAGYGGDWLFRTAYTTFPQRGLFVYLPFILLGKLTAPPAQHEQMVALFHLFRFIAGVLLCLAVYDFISLFIQQWHLRRWGLALAILGGGLGWLLILCGQGGLYGSLPLDLYSPESFGFLMLFSIPHLTLARAFLLWGFVRYLSQQPEAVSIQHMFRFSSTGAATGVLWFCTSIFQPLTVLIGWGLLLFHILVLGISVWRDKKSMKMNIWWGYIRRAGWAVLFSSPLVLYTAAAFSFDPYAKIWAAQNQLHSPHPLHYILAYGLVLPLVVYGAVQIIRKERLRGWLPVSWVMVFPFWVYASVSIQRRLAEGVWVAMSVLVMAAIEKWRKGQRKAYQPVWLSITFFTTMFLLVGSMQAAVNLRMPIFRPAQETQFFKAVRSQVEDGSVVLASFNTSNSLPAWAPVRVVIGHGPESVAVEENTQVAEAFYRVDTDDSARQKLLYEQGIDYVIFGPEEARLGEWFPINDAYLTFIFGMEDYYLFKVRE